MVAVVGEALARLAPAELSHNRAVAGFATNRRVFRRSTNAYHMLPNMEGPADHDVPVLRVTGTDGKVRAIMFGYACHNTAANFYTINGDYAGFAMKYLEQAHPGAVAVFK